MEYMMEIYRFWEFNEPQAERIQRKYVNIICQQAKIKRIKIAKENDKSQKYELLLTKNKKVGG